MIFDNPYWEDKTKVELLQRWILVHSHLYYDLNASVVSDHMFDNNCRQLHQLKLDSSKAYSEAKYSYAMQDFEGSTGFGFVEQLTTEHRDLIMRDAANLKDGVM